MLITEDILKDFLKENNAEFALIINYSGSVVTSVNVDNDDSIAAMSSAIISMCNKYLEDLEKDSLKQMIIKTNDSILIFAKIDDEKVVVVAAKTGINLGMILHQSELLAKKLI